jgi:hypothetical protein
MPNIKLIKKKEKLGKAKVDLSTKTVLQIDNGLFTAVGQHLGKYFKKVWYCRPTAAAFLKGSQHVIGKGLPGIEWVDDYEPYVKKADIIFVSDVNYSHLQLLFQQFGCKVAGALGGERMELDKAFFLEQLAKVGLPVPKTWRFIGVDEAWEFLKDKKEKLWLKGGEKYRGDFESTYHDNKYQTEIIFNELRAELGLERVNDIELLVQRDIPDAIEVGRDGFMLNGKIPANGTIGIEEKSQFYVCKVFETPPPILENISKKLEPIFADLKFQGPYSDETRVTKKGVAYPIDPCCRPGNPPTSCLLELYGEDYAQAIWSLAHGDLPILKPQFTHAAEIILSSSWHAKNELHVSIPNHLIQWVKLRNAIRRPNGEYYCIQNDCGGSFGSVVAVGNSISEVGKLVEERAEELNIYGLEYTRDFLKTMKPKIAKAKAYAGIDLN